MGSKSVEMLPFEIGHVVRTVSPARMGLLFPKRRDRHVLSGFVYTTVDMEV